MNTFLRKRAIMIGLLLSLSALALAQTPLTGTDTDVYNYNLTSQNQVAVQGNDTVVFVHRQNYSYWGSSREYIRYDISIDGGVTFSSDLGPCADIFSYKRAHPQIAFTTADSTGALRRRLAWTAQGEDAMPQKTFANGVIFKPGVSDFAEDSLRKEIGLTGGLCERVPGELWTCAFGSEFGELQDSLYLFKGIVGPTGISWDIYESFYTPHYDSLALNKRAFGPNMAFSPDGMNGWMVFLGDLNDPAGGRLSIVPIAFKTTDGGASWDGPHIVQVDTIGWIQQELMADCGLTGYPCGSGIATLSEDYDVTVDSSGNPHIFAVVANRSERDINGNLVPKPYGFQKQYTKIAIDITTKNFGNTWEARKVSPILTHSHNFVDPISTASVEYRNFCQVSRTIDGSHIFYSWVDTDTCGLNAFGTTGNNIIPNLRIAGFRVSDEFATPVKKVTDAIISWHGVAYWASMAPEVIEIRSNPNKKYQLPIVFAGYVNHAEFHYAGQIAFLEESNFIASPALEWCCNDITFGTDCILSGADEAQLYANEFKLECFPTIVAERVNVRIRTKRPVALQYEMFNMLGQKIRSETIRQKFSAGDSHFEILLPENQVKGTYFIRFAVSDRRGNLLGHETKRILKQ